MNITGKMTEKRSKVTREDLINLWLKPYHGLSVQELIEKYPEECKSSDWFDKFPCTQSQCDEWEKLAKELVRKDYKLSKRRLEREWGFIYLDTVPSIIKENN